MGDAVNIPNLGDIEEVEVIEICIAPGDIVSAQDTLIVIESDKASMDVPAGIAGTVESIAVELGDMVGEGTLIAMIVSDEAVVEDAAVKVSPSEDESDSPAPAPELQAEDASEPVHTASDKPRTLDILVPDIGEAKDVVVIEIAVAAGQTVAVNDLLVVLESDKASMEISAEYPGEIIEVCVQEDDEVEKGTLIARIEVESSEPVDAPAADEAAEKPRQVPSPEKEIGSSESEPDRTELETEISRPEGRTRLYAGPATRRLARELGVDLANVTGSGQRGRIVKDDVKAFVKERLNADVQGAQGSGLPAVPVIDFARYGPTRIEPLSRIRRRGAANLHASWVNLPHVTQHDEADVTDLETFRAELKAEAEQKGVRVTPLSFIVKACSRVLSEYPEFNASLAPNGEELIVKEYINIGVAVDTPEGLVVPVIKDADKKDIWTLSAAITDLAEKARDKKLSLDDLAGGTFSVSSLGALGGTGFTPIVNAPEVAILGVARLGTKALWDGETFVPRKVLPLSLSYDHRVINGADGGRFMARLIEFLNDWRRLSL